MQLLRVASIDSEPVRMSRAAQRIGDHLVLFTVSARERFSPAEIVHWLLEDGRKPPFDVAIHAPSGRLVEITFFVSHEFIERDVERFEPHIDRKGQPIFDTSLWPDWPRGDRYYTTPGEARLRLLDADLEVTFAGSTSRSTVGDGNATFLISSDQQLTGIALPQLSRPILDALRDAHVVAGDN